jgi:hypothetical protein
MTSSCTSCGMPLESGSGSCRFCNTSSLQSASTMTPPRSSTKTPFRASGAAFRERGKFEDLAIHLLDLLLLLVTLGIGGLIWSIVLAFSGQTPAGKIRDQVLVNVRNSSQAAAWKLILRQTLTFIGIAYLVLTVLSGFAIVFDVGGYYFATYGIPGIILGLLIVDTLLHLTPMRRRLVDWALAIRWTDGNGHSFRNYKPQTGF